MKGQIKEHSEIYGGSTGKGKGKKVEQLYYRPRQALEFQKVEALRFQDYQQM
jgi:hypothetical protein